jgi:hypothetical protein
METARGVLGVATRGQQGPSISADDFRSPLATEFSTC